MTNSADPDQSASKKPTDLDLHCLQKQGISMFSRIRVKIDSRTSMLRDLIFRIIVSHNVRKYVFGHVCSAKPQISMYMYYVRIVFTEDC